MTRPAASRSTYDLQLFAICAGLTALALKQAPARLVGDTKLDLAVDPVRLMTRALHLWDPSRDFGLTQNQNYGYLFPMGPFFALGRAIGLPAWAVQRLWWSVLLCLAFLGVVKLAEALGIGNRTSGIIAGLAFALSPRVLSTLGPISVESLPYCLAPWVLLPLVRGGPPRRQAARSAVAVLCMGAVNAVAVLAALPPAVLWLLTRQPGPARRRLMAWWVGCVLLATSWWLVPLLLLGRYSPPFLDFIETAATTTAVTSLIEVLRGTSDWVAYLNGPAGPTWPAGYALLSNRLVVVYTVVVLLAGIAAMLRRDLPERLWLTTCLLLGVAGVTAGHLGPLSGLLADLEHAQLDAALAPLRNVHKLDVVLRLPLVLAIAHLVGRLMESGAPAEAARRQHRIVTVAAAAAVLGAALPALSVGLAPRHPFVEVPPYWGQTAQWLSDHEDDGAALLLPGSSFPDYLWGNSNDEPLQPLASSRWAVRSAIPLTPAGTIRALDAVEQRVAGGAPSPGLAPALTRMGIGYVVVRNDLAYAAAGSTRPLLVHSALAGSPGVTRVKAFGPMVGGGNGLPVDEGVEVAYRAVEVFRIGSGASRAQLNDLASVPVVAGGPEALLDLEARDLLAGRPTVLAADAGPDLAAAPVVLTDSLRRREVQFGRLAENRSQTLTASDELHLDAPARDYLPSGTAGREVVARYVGARSVSASSSAADASAFGGAHPDSGPYAAVDGAAATSWRSDPGRGAAGAFWRIGFDVPRSLAGLRIVLGATRPKQIRVTGGRTSRVLDVPRDGVVRADLDAVGDALVVAAVAPRGVLGSFDIAEVQLPGLEVRRTLDLPRVPRADVIALDAAPGARLGCYPTGRAPGCSSRLVRLGEDSRGLDRTLHVDTPGRYRVAATARPVGGAALNALLDLPGVRVTASSSAVQDPAARPAAAYDGDPRTGWRAALDDRAPTLTVQWAQPHRLTRLRLVVSDELAASRTGKLTVTGDDGTRTAALDEDDQYVDLDPPLVTQRLTLRLQVGTVGGTVDPYSGELRLLPLGISELEVKGAPPAGVAPADVVVPCGEGPTVRVGAEERRTGLRASRKALLERSVIPLEVCEGATLPAGDGTEVRVATTTTLEPVSITLSAVDLPAAAALPVTTEEWGPEERTIGIPARTTPALLQVHENTNPGWRATLDGKRLRPVVVDGWQQGWVVEAGAAGAVRLDYSPDTTYRTALLVGGLLALVLLVLALVPGRAGTVVLARRTALWHVLVLSVVLALIGGPAALALGAAAAVITLLLPERAVVALGVGAVALAGAVLVVRPWGFAGYLGRGFATQALCLTGLAAIWSMLLRGWGIDSGRLPRRMIGRSRNR